MASMPQDAPHTLILIHEASGLRHTLAGKPVYAGDILSTCIDGQWINARYEWSFTLDERPMLESRDFTMTIQEDTQLRWPTPGSD